MRPAADAGSGNDLGKIVPVHISSGDRYSTAEIRVVSKILEEQQLCGSTECLDVRPAAGARAGDDVSTAIAVDVAGGHEHTAEKARVISQKLAHEVAGDAIKDADVRAAAGAGRG